MCDYGLDTSSLLVSATCCRQICFGQLPLRTLTGGFTASGGSQYRNLPSSWDRVVFRLHRRHCRAGFSSEKTLHQAMVRFQPIDM